MDDRRQEPRNLTDRELLLLIVQEVQQKLPIIEKRLDSHAKDIKNLREWRFYYGGGLAVLGSLATYLGLKNR